MIPMRIKHLLINYGLLQAEPGPKQTKEQLLAQALMELEDAGVIDLDEVVALLRY